MEKKEISKAVLKRLPGYLAYLQNMPEGSNTHISATSLANALGMGEVQVRKDLAMVSDGGRPKIGYLRESLIDDIEQFIKDNYMSVILMSANEKIRSISALIGVPIRIPNPRFGESPLMENMEPNGLTQ